MERVTTYISNTLKENRLMPRPLRVSECADCLGTFVLVGGEEVVEAFMA